MIMGIVKSSVHNRFYMLDLAFSNTCVMKRAAEPWALGTKISLNPLSFPEQWHMLWLTLFRDNAAKIIVQKSVS